MKLSFPSKVQLACTPTPFYCLEKLSAQLGGPRIWIKRDDLTECGASGNKIRKLEFVLARAREAGCDTLITSGGLQSNHCRATALLGARLGLKVKLLLRDEGRRTEVPEGNLLLDYLAGAEVTVVRKQEFVRFRDEMTGEMAQESRAAGATPWIVPVGASDGHGVWGYIGCSAELVNDFKREGIAPEVIFHATGSGGTQAGLSAGAYLFDLPCKIVGMAVCDDAAYFIDKVRADLAHWESYYKTGVDIHNIPLEVNDNYIGPGYAKASKEVFDVIKQVARTEGIILDPVYTGKAFYGMMEEINQGRLNHCKDVVFIHTGGIYGLLAQGRELGFMRSDT